MPVSANVKHYFKGITVAFLGVVAAVLGITAVGLFGDYFDANPLHATVMFSGSLGIDVFGAVVPLIVAFVAAGLFIKSVNAPIKKLSLAVLASVFLAFLLFHLTDEGIAGSPLLFALAISTVSGAVTVFPKPHIGLRNNFAASLMLALVCVPLSVFLVDLYYSRYFACAAIGGSGLNDGMLLSTLYVPLAVTVVFSALVYASQTVWLIGKLRTTSPKPPTTTFNPTISEPSKSQG
ncbi:MAG: hypothetical protein ACQCN6_02795 [Candidatus Bathyarchaeia archaeon]|jgi:hypothetical protein